MKDRGAEVLVETARLWLDAGHEEKGQFRIDAVTGPDEYTCVVNNNFYTNAVARENLSWAAKIIKILDKQGMAEDVRKKLNITKEELRAFVGSIERGEDAQVGIIDGLMSIRIGLACKKSLAENRPVRLEEI